MLGFSPECAHENAIQTSRNKQVRDSDTIPELSNFCCPPAKPVVYLTEIKWLAWPDPNGQAVPPITELIGVFNILTHDAFMSLLI